MRIGSLTVLLVACPLVFAAPPTVTDPRLVLELVAEAPDIVTPTGLAIDAKGRIWCLENHTHQRTPDYKGPPTDRVRVFEDFDAGGKARKIWTFAEGFRDSMGLTFDRDGVLYLATRAAIFRMPIKDDKETERKVIVRLETKGNYPHNGLCGFTWDLNGDLIFGLGENLGESYKLIGSDGSMLTGGGEGGSMFRCRPDGSHVSRICTGFWNPFAHCVDSRGRLFVVDNDPDARGPCRLLHAVQGGDFGYRFRYGRKGTHPFQCWDGELPGTLPMVAGTSEAPSGVLEYEMGNLPSDYLGKLFVTSWGDHTVEAFNLSPRGASFSATPKVIIRGDENFRPVAIALTPDGSLVFNDWVDKSYPVHGKGRIWRLHGPLQGSYRPTVKYPRERLDQPPPKWLTDPSPERRMAAILKLQSPDSLRDIIPTLADADPFLVSAAIKTLGKTGNSKMLIESLSAKPQAAHRLGLLLALRRTGDAEARESIGEFLADPEPGIRRAAIQWVAEEKLTAFAEKLEAAASKSPVTRELFEAWLAARELLDGKKPGGPKNETAGEDYVAAILKDAAQPVLFRTLALRSLRPDHPLLAVNLLADLFKSPDKSLRREVLRTLVVRGDSSAHSLLQQIAADKSESSAHRAWAVAGLGAFADSNESVQKLLVSLLANKNLRIDALRSLRGVKKQTEAVAKSLDDYAKGLEPIMIDLDLMAEYGFTLRSYRPSSQDKFRTIAGWKESLKNGDGSAQDGERVFFHPKGPGCAKCHRVDNRGGIVGPDLSFIGRSSNRDKFIESILEPSKEIAPMYTAWKVLTRDGKERVGLLLGETFDSFVLIGDAQGKIEKIHRTQIEERSAQTKSLMPDDLANQMTKQEFLDLLAFLTERK